MNEPRIKKIKIQKPKRRKGTVNKTLVVSALAVLCLVIIAFTPYFRINYVIIEGNEYVNEESILEVSGISKGMNTFSIKLSEVKSNLLSNSYIHDVKIKREFPNGLRIVVTESKPVAVMPYAEGKFVLIDNYAKILKVLDMENGDYPEITGVSITGAAGQTVKPAEKRDESKIAVIPEILGDISECDVKDSIVEINLSDVSNITLRMNGGKLEARLCDIADFDYKLKMLSAIKETLEREGKTEGIIDFAGEAPVYRPSDIIIDSEENESE